MSPARRILITQGGDTWSADEQPKADVTRSHPLRIFAALPLAWLGVIRESKRDPIHEGSRGDVSLPGNERLFACVRQLLAFLLISEPLDSPKLLVER